jgi:hypothetical protein
MIQNKRLRRAVALHPALLASLAAHAAGGHHAVDDASILEPGQCQVESWADREAGGARSLQHIGPTCRVGGVELGLNVDRVRLAGAGTTTVSPQVKWAMALDQRFSTGLVLSTAWQDRAPRHVGSTLVVPFTWQAADTLLVHLNAGRDFHRHEADSARAGAALEWAPRADWSFVAERFHEGRADYWRAGARWVLTPAVNVDLSRARGLGAAAPAWWTLGLTWAFDR